MTLVEYIICAGLRQHLEIGHGLGPGMTSLSSSPLPISFPIPRNSPQEICSDRISHGKNFPYQHLLLPRTSHVQIENFYQWVSLTCGCALLPIVGMKKLTIFFTTINLCFSVLMITGSKLLHFSNFTCVVLF